MLAKRRLQKSLIIGTLLSFAAVLTLGLGYSSLAQSGNGSGTANALKISTLRTDITANPGETKTVKVTVTNPSEAEVSIRIIQNDFVASKDEDGTPDLILEEDEYAPSHSLKRFMQPVENVLLGPGESKPVEVTLVIPADAEAGGYFGAISFAPESPDSGGQVNMSASVASLILLAVNGDAKEKLDLTDFVVQKNSRPGVFFTNSEDLEVMARFYSESAVQVGPAGKISVIKGDDIVYEVDFNNKDQRDVILPDSARRWYIPVNSLQGFGKYEVAATFTYGTKNQTLEATKSFWVIPVWMIVASIVVLVAVVALVIYLIMRRRSGGRAMSLG